MIVRLLLPGLLVFAVTVQPQPRPLVLRNAHVLDGRHETPLTGVTIVVVGGRIQSVGTGNPIPTGALELDLRGRWVLPGLIDDHTHISSMAAARAALSAGVTTVRTMQVNHYADIGLRAMHASGAPDLPMVLASGYQLRPDMFEEFFLDHPNLSDMMPRAGGAENARRLVRANVERGVDQIKILATERAGTPQTDPRRRTWTDEELEAIVDEARRNGLDVVAHAHGDEGAAAAIRAGVREIHHGSFMSDATLRLLKGSGGCLVTTAALLDAQPPTLEQEMPALWRRNQEIKRATTDLIGRALKLGVPIAAGTDGDYVRNANLTIVSEMESLIGAGVPPIDALSAATSRAADCMRLSDRTGTLRAGLEADIIAVEGNPLNNIRELRSPSLIINDGRVVLNKLGP